MVAFKVGDLVLMNSDSWWLASGGSRYKNYTDKDRRRPSGLVWRVTTRIGAWSARMAGVWACLLLV